MSMGGQMADAGIAAQADLVTASTGVTVFDRTGWHRCCVPLWVLDYYNHGRQRQRIARGEEFLRPSGLAALYRPHLPYCEFQRKGERVDESFILFTLGDALSATFSQLTEPDGYCHFEDSAHIIGDSLRRLGELLFVRRPGFALFAQGAFLDLLGTLATARTVKPGLREAIAGEAEEDGLLAAIAQYIRSHISEPIQVPDLAAHVHLSVSAFAHTYPRLAGETPLRTINRLKVERAKTLMLQEGLSVKESAYRLGFSSEFHFSRVFKRVEGLSPRHYLRALAAKRG